MSFAFLKDAIRTHPYGFVTAVVVAWYLLKKLRFYSQAKHCNSMLSVPSVRTAESKSNGGRFDLIPNPQVFPHLFLNSQGP